MKSLLFNIALLLSLSISFSSVFANPDRTDKDNEVLQVRNLEIERSNIFWRYLINTRKNNKFDTYLPLTGGTLTGNIEIAGDSNKGVLINSMYNNENNRNWAIINNYHNWGELAFVQSTSNGANPIFSGIKRLSIDVNGNTTLGGALTGTSATFTNARIGAFVGDASYSRFGHSAAEENTAFGYMQRNDGVIFFKSSSDIHVQSPIIGTSATFSENVIAPFLKAETTFPKIDLVGLQAAGRNYSLTSYILGVTNAGFAIRDNTASINVFTIDAANNFTLAGPLSGTSANFKVDNISDLGAQVSITNGHGNQNGSVRLNLGNAGAVSWIKGLVTGANTNGGSAMVFGVPSSNTDGIERMRIDANGNLCIGTINPKGYKLAVAGNVIAESVKVALQGSWPDYVFKSENKLLSLPEVEKYVREKSHLPEMPSEAEVKKEGIDLGQMDAKLLKKIEELTLYMIEQNRDFTEMRKALDAQNKLVQLQNERIATLEKQIK